jgi:hypothetical protein
MLMMKWERCGEKQPWPLVRSLWGLYLRGLRKAMKSVNQHSWFQVGTQMGTSKIQIRLITAVPTFVKVIFVYNVYYCSDHVKFILTVIFKSDE